MRILSLRPSPFRYFICFSLFLMFCGCSSNKDIDDPVDPFKPDLTVASGELPPLSASGSSATVHFSTNEPWTVDASTPDGSDADWFRFSPTAGEAGENRSVTIHADANPTYEPRSFTLTLRTTSLVESLTVSQLKRNAIIAGENRYELSGEEQTLAVEVQANVEYEVEIASGGEWLSQRIDTRAEPGLTSHEHRFDVAANTEPAERTATIVFRDTDSDLSDEVTVVQAAWVDPAPERTALAAIYRQAHGDGWTRKDNWCSDRPLDEWYGVGTDAEGHVVELQLPHNNLCGGIAHEIANLAYLKILDLSYNDLEGDLIYELPENYADLERSDLDGLCELEEINLSHNRLRSAWGGTLALQNMPRLRRADLSHNDLCCWVSSKRWAPLFENGRTVELIFNGNQMFGEVDDFIQNHPEWDRLALQLVRQYYPDGAGMSYSKDIHIPDFTFTDLRTGAQQRMRDLCSANCLTMLLAWDPTDEDSRRFTERSVRRYHTLYGAQGFAVVAILPEGEEYRQAAEQYLASHEAAWPVVADYADAQGRRIVLPMEPYPSYLIFDREGVLVDDIHNEKSCASCRYPGEPPTFDLAELEFQYANYMNDFCYKVFGDCAYESKDYSMDKQVEILQRATKGKGVDIVLIGDVFTDIDIETGFYKDAMEFAMESFFEIEPTKSYREYFNVYTVYAVSKKRQIGIWEYDSALGTSSDKYVSSGISASPFKVDEYVTAAQISSQETFPAVIINGAYCGVTYLTSSTDAVPYAGLPYNGRTVLQGIFQHEAVGHAFGLLGDEYSSINTGQIPESAKQELRSYQRDGCFLNLSLTDDSSAVPWAHLIGHSRYPEVGVYTGGYCYQKGVWRSESNGIMNSHSCGYFNTYCRELIVRRILTLAGEEYTFEKFLEKDIPSAQATPDNRISRTPIAYRHCPPIFVDKK